MFVGKLSAWFVGTIAGIAQLAEQRTCNAQVFSSILNTGFARMAEWLMAADLKFVGHQAPWVQILLRAHRGLV